MIYDRTLNDVSLSETIRKEKVQKFQALTGIEIGILERGFLTKNTLNRIEEKQHELKTIFNNLGYWNIDIENKNWGANDYFFNEEWTRILNNENVLINSFFVYSETPKIPWNDLSYVSLNDAEKILYDLESMINDVELNYRECGDFECGEV